MAVTIQVRRDTAANWVSANPVLHQGEPGMETDTGRFKYGDGSTAWTSLGYAAQQLTPTTKTTTYAASPGDYVKANIASSSWTLTLPAAPAANTVVGAKVISQVTAGALNILTVACGGSDRFEQSGGATSTTLYLPSQAAAWQYNGGYWTRLSDDLPLSQLGALFANVFSPMAFGAKGNGTTDDTTAVTAAFSAAAAASGTVDLGTYTFKTSSAIPLASDLHVKGCGLAGGAITNSASDLFTVSGSVSAVIFEDCCLTSASGGGHIWNAGTASMSFWDILGVQAVQDNPGKSIWHQTGGAWIDCTVDKNCILTGAAFATVSPWSMTGIAGNINSVRFGRMRCNANAAPVPFFLIDPGSTSGWNEEIVFDHITFEVTTGGAIAMTGCIDVLISMCSLWDIPGARTDTGCTVTSGSPSVTDASAGSGDVGKAINGTGVPAGTVITAVSGTTVTMSQNATANGTSVTVGGPAANQYSFTRSSGNYATTGIQVRGGRANSNTASAGTGYADFYADSYAASIVIESFGSWGTPAVITSPPAQTIILSPAPTSSTAAMANRVPGMVLTGAENAISTTTALTASNLSEMNACTVSSAYTVTLPTPVSYNGQQIGIRVTPGSTKLLTLATAAGNIDGASTRIMWAGESALLESDGTNWVKIAGKTLPMTGMMSIPASTVTVATGTVTNVPLTVTLIDNTGLMCNTTNTYITVQRGNNYQVTGRIAWPSIPGTGSARTITACYVNGSSSTVAAQDERYAINGSFPCISAVGEIALTAAAYVTVSAFQQSGSTLTLSAGSSSNPGAGTILALTEIPSW